MATRGNVKWFDPKKGFGFIIGPTGQDVFVHYSQIQGEGFRSLKDGEPVDYELVQGEKGWQARAVQRLSPPPSEPVDRAPNPSAGQGRAASPAGPAAPAPASTPGASPTGA